MRLSRIGMRLLAFLAGATPALGQVSATPEAPKRFDLAAIDAYVGGVVRQKGLVGLSLAIVRDGQVVMAKGYGLRSLEDRQPVEPTTTFAVGSVTKQFACAAILLLAEDGKLSVDDKVAKFFPDLTRAGEITLRQLMNHTSGYPDYYPLDFVDRRLAKPVAVDAILREYAGGKLDFEPGSRWSYSNTGYLLLGRVVEKAAGKPFGEFVRERILKPVGMEHAAVDPPRGEPSQARGYLPFTLGPAEPALPEADGWLYAAGGLWATASDVARWDVALMGGKVLNPESMKAMTTPTTLTDGRVQDYGFGLNVKRESGRLVLSHGGAISGFRATNLLIPASKSAVVVLINDEQPDPGIAPAIVALMLKADAPEDLIPKVVGPPHAEAARAFFEQLQSGKLDRSTLGEEFSAYLTASRVAGASARPKPLGTPTKVESLGVSERGGMEVASIRLSFPSTSLKGLLYRSPDGKVQQLLFTKE